VHNFRAETLKRKKVLEAERKNLFQLKSDAIKVLKRTGKLVM